MIGAKQKESDVMPRLAKRAEGPLSCSLGFGQALSEQ
jgi:hypothetical protein